VTRSRPTILEDLSKASFSAAAAALLLLSGCASGDASLRQDVTSLRAEVRTLQRENGDLARRLEAMGTQLDLLAARSTAPSQPATAAAAPAAAATDAAPRVPANLKVVRLEPPKAPPSKAAPRPTKAPAVPTGTPIQEPSVAAIAALGGAGKSTGAQPQLVLDAARSSSGLPRARALEQFADTFSAHPRACEALVDAARTRSVAGDPDGSCEDFSRAVSDYPAAPAIPEALEGLAACEQRRGRPAEAERLLTRLAKDFPDSPAARRAREHAPAVQGAAP
jgi:TolA-binding protein